MLKQYFAKLDDYLDLIDNLQKRKFSILLSCIRTMMVHNVSGDAARISTSAFSLAIESEGLPFINFENDPPKIIQLKTMVNTVCDNFSDNSYKILREIICKMVVNTLSNDLFNPLIKDYFINMQEHDEPFINFSQDPKSISQIKKLINALYHGECALKELEELHLRGNLLVYSSDMTTYLISQSVLDWWNNNSNTLPESQVFLRLWHETSHHIYKACYEVMHIHFDFDLQQIFAQELQKYFIPVLHFIQENAHESSIQIGDFFNEVSPAAWANKAGLISGIVVDQMHPHAGKMDLEYIINFISVLPNHLKYFAEQIEKLSRNVSIDNLDIDPRVLDLFHDNVFPLLRDLENIRDGNLTLNIAHYIHIINHIYCLIKEIWQETGRANNSTQELIKSYLHKLKYQILPEFFAFLDKTEATFLFRPGVLSKPSMDGIEFLYEKLLNLCSKFVDFSNDENLLKIEDEKFMHERFQPLLQKIAEEEHHMFMRDFEITACRNFFQALTEHHENVKCLTDLSWDAKNYLKTNFKSLYKYVYEINRPLANIIVESLNSSGSWKNYIIDNMLRVTGVSSGRSFIPMILQLEEDISNLIIKNCASYDFSRQINHDIMKKAYARVNFKLKPRQNYIAFLDDEDLKIIADVQNNLLADELVEQKKFSIKLFRKMLEIQFIEDILIKFTNILELELELLRDTRLQTIDQLPIYLKNSLKNLYVIFQPYLSSISIQLFDFENFDEQLVKALNNEISNLNFDNLMHVLGYLQNGICYLHNDILTTSIEKLVSLETVAFERSIQVLPLKSYPQLIRENYIFKEIYSTNLSNLGKFLENLLALLNKPAKDLIVRRGDGLPFPEVHNVTTKLMQCSQMIPIKTIFNCVYNLEKAILNLEQMRDDHYEMKNVYDVICVVSDINQACEYIKNLYQSPYLGILLAEFNVKYNDIYNLILKLYKPYIEDQQVPLNEKTKPYNFGVKFALSVLKILPLHINNSFDELPAQQVEHYHSKSKKTAQRIQSIIASSSNTFKLFLNLPSMFILFTELKKNVRNLASTSHNAVVENLETIRDKTLLVMLLEADNVEDRLALIPGTITNTLQNILEEFYLGLIEPLGLKSSQYIQLVSSELTLNTRIKKINDNKKVAKTNKKAIEQKITLLNSLLSVFSDYQQSLAAEQIALHGSEVELYRWLLTERYNQVLHMLSESKDASLTKFWHNYSCKLPQLVLSATTSDIVYINHLEKMVTYHISYFQGLKNTLQFSLDTIKQKQKYLFALQESSHQKTYNIITNYAKRLLNQQVQSYMNTGMKLLTCEEEYKRDLTEYIYEHEAHIIYIAMQSEELTDSINIELRQQINNFHIIKEYHRLDAIREQINRLQLYLDKLNNNSSSKVDSVYENIATWKAKRDMWLELRKRAWDGDIDVSARIQSIKSLVAGNDLIADKTFSEVMLAQKEHYSFNFSAFKRCILTLMEWLGLYTPEYKINLKKFNELTSDNLAPQTLGSNFGIFAENQRGYAIPTTDSLLPSHISLDHDIDQISSAADELEEETISLSLA